MKNIQICDVTMKQSAKALSLSFREKIELSKLLDALGADAIELEGIDSSRTDALRIKSVAAAVGSSTVCVPVKLDAENIRQVWEAVKLAKHPRLQVCAAVSSVQMEYLYHKKAEGMLCCVVDALKQCRALCDDVEFVADDATRADPDFLQKILAAAVEAGATAITLCDTAGTVLPEEFGSFVAALLAAVPQLQTVSLGVFCCDTLSLADACAVAALQQGATALKAASYPVGTASLANLSRILAARGDALDARCNIRTAQLSRIMGQITWLCQADRKKSSAFDSGIHPENDIYLTVHDSMEAVAKAVEQLGYALSKEDIPRVYEAFTAIAAKKEKVSIRELDAIVAAAAMQVPSAYQLETYLINAGNAIGSSAHMRLRKGDTVLEGVCLGDGPIDAAFQAIETITGRHYELDDFQIQAVTEGREAMGQTIVRLRSEGKLYSGRGISTDIVCAGIHAYLSALNKIVYEEEDV
jgi:2-isopropylmalate synthase